MDEREMVTALDADSAADSIDQSLEDLAWGQVTAEEAFAGVKATVSVFATFAVGPTSDLELVIDYARAAVESLALRRDVMDPVLIEVFDEWLRGRRMVEEMQAQLAGLISRSMSGDDEAIEEIEEICRSGRRSHSLMLLSVSAVERVLRTAFAVECADGLRDAVSPTYRSSGQIASPATNGEEFRLAFDLLAQLASDPLRGGDARAALLDLADHVGTAGEAVIRLPLHLLDDDDRYRLLEIHEGRAVMFHEDSASTPLGSELLRDNRLLRGAVWQAFDSRHVC